ncbi:unnamed protein product [Clonostachys rosea]|uniref:Nucleoside phosphorylase domain-containing protein n=1 Tax=Bionectria ochroleuca TaxID=29856 RepID=A0ABY6U812_BIOOC|nr:unnamed protein product [Clonostachys rosea]
MSWDFRQIRDEDDQFVAHVALSALGFIVIKSHSQMPEVHRPQSRDDFHVAIVCALPLEARAIAFVVDEWWDENGDQFGKVKGDQNTYRTCRIGHINVVLVVLPQAGRTEAASTAMSLGLSYSQLNLIILAGICGGVPGGASGQDEIILGDVIIATEVLQFDVGRQYQGHFETKRAVQDQPGRARRQVRSLIATLQSESEDFLNRVLRISSDLQQAIRRRNHTLFADPGPHADKLFKSTYIHQHQGQISCVCTTGSMSCFFTDSMSCDELGCEAHYLLPRKRLARLVIGINRHRIFFGRIACADTVMRSGQDRDAIAERERVIAFEMESVGIWDQNSCLVVKGVSDYADSHKSKQWQPFAALMAASAVKAILLRYTQTDSSAGIIKPKSEG